MTLASGTSTRQLEMPYYRTVLSGHRHGDSDSGGQVICPATVTGSATGTAA